MKKKKLHITRTTIQQLSPSKAATVHGGGVNKSVPCLTANCSNNCPTFTASCRHSVCDSCLNTDCCLIVP